MNITLKRTLTVREVDIAHNVSPEFVTMTRRAVWDNSKFIPSMFPNGLCTSRDYYALLVQLRRGQDRHPQRDPDLTRDVEQIPECGAKPPGHLRPIRPYIPIELEQPPPRQFRALTEVPGKPSLEAF